MPANTTHDQYNYHAPDWAMIRDFCAGSRAVKDRGEIYLPKLDDQTPAEYEAYKRRAKFLNATQRTIAGLVGVVFRRQPLINLGPSNARLTKFLSNITQDGAPVEVLARNIVEETIRMGRYGLLVDRPADGGQPYIAEYKAEHIINWRQRCSGGRKWVDQVVVAEYVDAPAPDGFGTVFSQHWRELQLEVSGDDVVYRQRTHMLLPGEPDPRRPHEPPPEVWHSSSAITPVNRGVPFREIPFVFVGPNGLTADCQRSPILDIVDVNLHHYLNSADLEHGRHYCGLPVWSVSGFVGNEGEVNYTVGPNKVWLVPQDGEAKLLEFTGQGLKALETAVQEAKSDMALLGARLIGTQARVASEASDVATMRERGEHATLWGIVDSCERALTKALQYWVEWQDGDPSEVSVQLNKDFVEAKMEYRDLLQLMRAWQEGVIGRDVVITAMYEGDALPSRMTPDDVKAGLSDQSQKWVDPKVSAEVAQLKAELAALRASNPSANTPMTNPLTQRQ